MVVSSLLAKGALITVGAGIVGSAIAVPTVMALKASELSSPITIENFPDKDEIQGKCQGLTRDAEDKKYLLACSMDSDSNLKFHFYSKGEEKPLIISTIKDLEKKANGTVEISLSLSEDGLTSQKEEKFLTSNNSWIDSLSKVGLASCKRTNKEKGGDARWIIKCSGSGEETPNIHLIPLII